MSSTEAPISITAKTPSGSLVTIRAENPADLDTLVALGIDAIASAVVELENKIRGEAVANTPSPIQQAQAVLAQQLGATAYQPAPLGGGGRQCPHGKMTAIQGASKQGGGIYKGYFCASAQGDPSKCKTIYLDAHSTDWATFVPERMK